MKRCFVGLGLGLALVACVPAAPETGSVITPQAALGAEVTPESLHERLMVLDSHLDIPARFHTDDYAFGARQVYAEDGTQVDLPRMVDGGLDGGFFVIYTRQGPLTERGYIEARGQATLRQAAIREVAAKYDEAELAFTADEVDALVADGKRVVLQSMENAYPLGLDVSMLETFYQGGLRMMGPVHFANNQFADSATDPEGPAYEGLSPLGEDLVREANRLGIILDGSHASDDAVRDMMALSTTPIVLSHSGPKTIYDHPRNVPDELMIAIAEDGGVIQINALGAYLEKLDVSPERAAGLAELAAQFGADYTKMSPEAQTAYVASRRQLDKVHPAPRSSFDKYMEHLLYSLNLIGPDHIGIGADWDGGGGVEGMSDITYLPRVTEALLEAGYTEAELAKIWGGNLVRLMRDAEAARTANVMSPASVN